MPTFSSPADRTTLAYHATGDGPPLVCLPGGPMRDSAYLDGLDDLADGPGTPRRVIRLDLRGTGRSAVPEDPATYRCDRLVDDVEALRAHLGLDQMDLLAHSAAASLAALYVARHPERVGRLVLITPSTTSVGITVTADDRRETARLRQHEPWFPAAFAALEAVVAGQATEEHWQAMAPFKYGRWDEATQAYEAAGAGQRHAEAAAAFEAEGAVDPDANRAALARFRSPVLVLAGEVDVAVPPRVVAEFAGLFPNAKLVTQPGAGHFPWLDDPGRFTATTTAFLA
jgi:pimeloyl-ACP methyl ester carboxylesterase